MNEFGTSGEMENSRFETNGDVSTGTEPKPIEEKKKD